MSKFNQDDNSQKWAPGVRPQPEFGKPQGNCKNGKGFGEAALHAELRLDQKTMAAQARQIAALQDRVCELETEIGILDEFISGLPADGLGTLLTDVQTVPLRCSSGVGAQFQGSGRVFRERLENHGGEITCNGRLGQRHRCRA